MRSSETTENNTTQCKGFSSPLTQPFQLSDWQVVPERNIIVHRHKPKPRSIEPRLMQLLCFLAANPLSVIDRETLVQHLWPNVIVNENSLTRAISELRKQLRGGCDEKTIETIPKRGYRLSQAVAICDDTPIESHSNYSARIPSAPLANTMAFSESMWSHPRLALLSLAFGVLLSIGLVNNSFILSKDSAEGISTLGDEVLANTPDFLGGELELSSVETASPKEASISEPIVSHDGRDFAYIAYNPAGSTVYVGTLNQMGEPYPVYHDSEKLVNLSWSPVGRSLLFTKKPNMRAAALFEPKSVNELLVLDIATGELRRLVEDSRPRSEQSVGESNLT